MNLQLLTLLVGIIATSNAAVEPPKPELRAVGLMCASDKGLPVRSLDPTKRLDENCARLTLAGIMIPDPEADPATPLPNMKVAVNLQQDCNQEVAAADAQFIADVSTEKFRLDKVAELDVLSAQLATFDTCDKPTACLVLYREKEGGGFTAINKQSFAIGGPCPKQRHPATISILPTFAVDELDPIVVSPSMNLNSIFTKLEIRAEDANLPPQGVNLRWPRGVLIYMTQRPVPPQCDRKAADLTIEDEVLATIPVEGELTMDALVELPIDKMISFGPEPGKKCLMCGPVSIVVVWDWLSQEPPKADGCGGYKVFEVVMDCKTSGIAPFPRRDVIPFYRNNGRTAYMRACMPGVPPMLLEMDEHFGLTAWNFDVKRPLENKGIARLKAVIDFFNEGGTAYSDFLDSEGDSISRNLDEAKLVTESCKSAVSAFLNGDELADVKTECAGTKLVEILSPKMKKNETLMAVSKGECPLGGFRRMKTDEVEMEYNDTEHKLMKLKVHGKELRCEPTIPDGYEGVRLTQMLFESPLRNLANQDLVREFEWEEVSPTVEDFETDWEEKTKTDVSFLKDCPFEHFLKPVQGKPAVWKWDEKQQLLRGYYNVLESAWCYETILSVHCPQCKPDEDFPGSGSGSGFGVFF